MFVLIYVQLFVFEVAEIAVFLVSSYKRESCFTQIILKKAVSRIYKPCCLGFKCDCQFIVAVLSFVGEQKLNDIGFADYINSGVKWVHEN